MKGNGKGKKGGKGMGGKGVPYSQTYIPNKGKDGKGKGGKDGKGKGGKKGLNNPKVDMLADVVMLSIQKYERLQRNHLDLTSWAAVEEMKKHKVDFNTDLWASVLGEVLKRCKQVEALTLDNNKIKGVRLISFNIHKVMTSVPNFKIDSLSLQHNEIQSIEELGTLASLRLRHLLLQHNTIYKSSGDKLEKAIKKALPTLQRIDDYPIVRTSPIDLMDAKPQPGGLNPNDSIHQVVREFMMRYFSCASNKASHNELLEMYDTRAVMSVTVGDAFKLGTSKAATSFVRGLVMNNHNLLRDTKLNPYVGKLNVGKCLQTLHSPETQYEEKIWECTEVSTMPESLREQTRMAVPSIVTVTMHGAVTFKFDTESSAPTKIEHKKLFDRTWVLTASGNPPTVRILNDMLHLRNPMMADDALFLAPDRKIYYGLHMCAQDEKVIELCRNVKLRPELARKCLEQAEVGWDLNKAFMDVKAKMAAGVLTADHFNEDFAHPLEVRVHLFSRYTGLLSEMANNCLAHEEVSYDLYTGYKLFLAKRPFLKPEHFDPTFESGPTPTAPAGPC